MNKYLDEGNLIEQVAHINLKEKPKPELVNLKILGTGIVRTRNKNNFNGFIYYLASHKGKAWLRKNKIKRVSK